MLEDLDNLGSTHDNVGRGELRSFASLRAAADAQNTLAGAMASAASHHPPGGGGVGGSRAKESSPSMAEHQKEVDLLRMKRASQRAAFLVQREEEAQTRAEVYALNRLMRRRELLKFEQCVTEKRTRVVASLVHLSRAPAVRCPAGTPSRRSFLASARVRCASPPSTARC